MSRSLNIGLRRKTESGVLAWQSLQTRLSCFRARHYNWQSSVRACSFQKFGALACKLSHQNEFDLLPLKFPRVLFDTN